MGKINIQYFDTNYGELILGSYNNHLILADWRYRQMRDRIDSRLQSRLSSTYTEKTDDIIETTRLQLNEYFTNKRTTFDIPFKFVGTEFQKSVWKALTEIPYGETASYLKLATNISKAEAVRAVANANGANAMSIIIPCHRIIGNNGSLGGYAGGLQVKEKLLNLENNLFS